MTSGPTLLERTRQASEPPRRAVQRSQRVDAMRRTALLLALVAVAFVQAPGQIVPDTKLDLSVAPGRFLAGAWHLWDPTTAMGSLRNQAYGYLWPMGPFFALGQALGLPAWVVQRAWWALLLVLAAAGVERLAARLGIGTPTTRLVAAASYALSARTVGELGAVSAELWPLALAPWVLLPLVTGAQGGSERRAAARSGLALACVGGVNAAATLMTLPLTACWLLTRSPGPRRRRLVAWWSLAVVLATTWWVVPLLLLGRFSPPFLDWIESSAVTTSQASAANALRGVTHWVPYLASGGGPQWPAGWDLLTVRTLVLAGGLLAAAGVAGLAWRGLPERGFLVGGALIGLALLTAGHVGAGAGPVAAPVAHLLDGPLAAFRNTHKADPVLRLPLALGLAHLLAAVRLRPVRQLPAARHAVPALGALAVLVAGAPALVGALPQPGSFTAVPGYWRQAAAWLDARPGEGRVLVLPGAMASVYGWGAPRDDVLQPLLHRPWAERDGVPLGTAGAIRVLDAVESRLSSGEASGGLAPFLARAGIEFLVLRNDVDWVGTGAPEPLLVHQTLARSGGLRPVAAFGPVVGGTQLPATYVDRGLDLPYPAVEVWRVLPYRGPVELRQAGQLLDVVGGPEDLLTLEDTGVLGQRAAVLDGDPLPAGLTTGGTVLTDGYRRREVDFGSMRDNVSSTLAAQQPFLADRAAHDYDLVPPRTRTVVRFEGAQVHASSSAADANSWGGRSVADRPDAAFDGDAATSWRSAAFRQPVGQWLQLDLDAARRPADVSVIVPDDPAVADISRLRVTTDTGQAETGLGPPGSPTRLTVPAGPTRHLRLTVTAVRSGGVAGIAEVVLPGVQVRRVVVAPPAPSPAAGSAATVVLRVPPGSRAGCALAGERPLCAEGLSRAGEQTSIDDDVTLAEPGRYLLTGAVVPRPGTALDDLLQPVGPAVRATASSALVPDPAGRPQAAVDRDLGTGWVASGDDPAPVLTLTLPAPRRLSGLQLLVDPALAASRPAAVQVSAGGRTGVEPVDAEGYVRFRPVTTDRVRLQFTQVDRRWSLSTVGMRSVLPVGVSEVRLLGADDLRRGLDPRASVAIPCGYAPSLWIDGRRIATRAQGRLGDLLTGRPLGLRACPSGVVALAGGYHRVTVLPSAELVPRSLSLQPRTRAAGEAPAVVPLVTRWDAEHRTLQVPPADVARVLTVHENANEGWRASLAGRALAPVRIDGWQQGWLVPAGAAGPLTLDYGPGRPYRAGLVVGALLVLALLALALLPARVTGRPPARALHRPFPAAALGAAVLVLAFGWTGLLALAVALPVAVVVRRRDPGAGALVAGTAAAGAAVLAAARPWPSAAPAATAWPAQLLALAAVACTLLVALPGTRSFRRRKGRSTR